MKFLLAKEKRLNQEFLGKSRDQIKSSYPCGNRITEFLSQMINCFPKANEHNNKVPSKIQCLLVVVEPRDGATRGLGAVAPKMLPSPHFNHFCVLSALS